MSRSAPPRDSFSPCRDAALALSWALAMSVLFALGWSVASVTGIGVDDQFTVFGAGGALLFTLLSGVLLARFTSARAPGA